MRRYITSKWAKTAALLANAQLRPHIPKTVRMSHDSLLDMLNEFGMVYVKPDIGTFGCGVMRVEKGTAASSCKYQIDRHTHSFQTYDAMYESIVDTTRGKEYLVQEGIPLLEYRGRRFDVRVMVQTGATGEWTTTGLIGRLSAPDKIVTNYHSGGTPMPVDTLLSPHVSGRTKRQELQRLHTLGVEIGKQIQVRYPGVREIGLDIGLDQNRKPWILEVNTYPDPYIFRRLKDKRVFRTILRFCRENGRIKARK